MLQTLCAPCEAGELEHLGRCVCSEDENKWLCLAESVYSNNVLMYFTLLLHLLERGKAAPLTCVCFAACVKVQLFAGIQRITESQNALSWKGP